MAAQLSPEVVQFLTQLVRQMEARLERRLSEAVREVQQLQREVKDRMPPTPLTPGPPKAS